uniref:Peptidase S1 domain-containing protein n=1 Tax=Anopheles maculatus TaxID=74869 RepID=A0A182SWM1_9DIPT
MKLLLAVVSIVSFITIFAKAQTRQVGGKDVSARQYPFVAVIAFTRQLVGNGAIITPKWILTSASAVYHSPDSEYNIGLGTDDFHSKADWHEVLKVLRYPEFVGWDNNIAMVQLRGTIKYSDTVQPINIATTFPETVEVTMLSYGKNEHDTTHLRAATYTLISDNVDCVGLLKE